MILSGPQHAHACSFNNSKSNSNNSSKIGRPELAQSNTYLQLTLDRHMQGTMKNLIFVARYVRCAITKESCAGAANLGLVYIRATSQCIAGVLGVEADLERW